MNQNQSWHYFLGVNSINTHSQGIQTSWSVSEETKIAPAIMIAETGRVCVCVWQLSS